MFHEFVAESMGQPVREGLNRYLVVDTAATRPMDISRSCGKNMQGIDLLSGAPCAWRDSASPVLIALTPDSFSPGFDKKTLNTLGQWRYANCFLYLESSHQSQAIARMLRDRTEALLPENLPVLLRYFDSRVFTLLQRVLTPPQLDPFLAIASRWAWPDRSGHLNVLQSKQFHDEGSLALPIVFSTIQEAALIESGEADAMIDLLLNQSNATLLTLLPPEQFACINAALTCATF